MLDEFDILSFPVLARRPMLLAFSTHRERLSLIVSNLEARSREVVVAVDGADVAQRLVELNCPSAIVVDKPEGHRAWLRHFARKFPNVHCAMVGVEAEHAAEMLSIAPNASVAIGDAVDWDEVMTAMQDARELGAALNSVVAVGAEDVLHLLGMTGTSAELEFVWGELRGRLLVRSGVVIHAERGRRRGIEVAYELLDWPTANVTSKALADGRCTESMHVSPAALLHEVALRRDERCRFAGAVGTQRVFDRLLQTRDILHVGVVHVDTVEYHVERHRLVDDRDLDVDLAALARWAQRCFLLWDDTDETERSAATPRWMQWDDGKMYVLVPILHRLALTVVGSSSADVAALRTAAERSAAALRESCAPSSRALGAELALQWG